MTATGDSDDMDKVIVALDNHRVAHPVAVVAGPISDLFRATLEAVHVREDGAEVAATAAAAAGLDLRMLSGPPRETLAAVTEPPDVRALVLGTRGAPEGREPAGTTALELITSVPKPLVAVPPQTAHPERLGSVLVPLDGTQLSSAAIEEAILLARGLEVKVIVLHVLGEHVLPEFSGQAYHEDTAWAEEFLTRYCPCPIEEVDLELRVGVPDQHVLTMTEEVKPDLLALGWSQDLTPGRAAVVRTVLKDCSVPVMLVPVSPTPRRPDSARPRR